MKNISTTRLKALVKASGLSIVDFAALTEVSHRRVTIVLSPSSTSANFNLDTLLRFSVVLAVYLEREPEDVFYDILEETLRTLDVLWNESDKNPSETMRKLSDM